MGFEINYGKTKVMILGSNRKLKSLANIVLPQIIIDGNLIPYVNTTKHLGVHLSANLSWDFHISQFLRRLFTEEDPEIRRSDRLAAKNNISFKMPNFATTTYEHSFVVTAIRLWKDLPPEIVNVLSLETFKVKLFDFLISNE
ncbi:Protein of unknown function [Cotesia congregata]|uniref:Uncharacterized protein n=1 Tax=Cotesia congregata TaxID=51543 RepID=A0A8J2H885_COTCN|nr:Protein of unknown function [Cotesia congregata]